MIIKNELLRFFRNKNALALKIIFPIVLIFLLGNLLQSGNFAEDAVGKLRIGYKITTNSPAEAAVVAAYIERISEGNIQFIKTGDMDEARKQVAENQLEGAVEFDQNEIRVYEGKDAIQNRTIGALVSGISQMSKAVSVIEEDAPEGLAKTNGGSSQFVQEKDFNANRTMLDYYGISMLVMTLFTGAVTGVDAFKEEKRKRTLNRLLISPLNRTNVFLQKVLGQIPAAIIEIVIIMAVSVLFFHVHYGATVTDNLVLILLFFLTSVAALMTGVVLGMVINGNPMLYVLGPVWIMSLFSGTFAKEIYIKGISELLPVYKIQKAAFDITVFGRMGKALSIMLVETVMILGLIVLGGSLFCKKKEAK